MTSSTETVRLTAAPTAARAPLYVYLISASVAFEIFSGNSFRLGLPIGLDRVCFAAGLLLLLLDRSEWQEVRLRARPVHVVMVLLVVWASLSAVAAETLLSTVGFFGLLDKLGVVPFLMFALAPIAFRDKQRRNVLLGMLVASGLYLGLVALFESFGLDALVWPRYILDPGVGIHFGRARGPFVEAVANGLAMIICGVAGVLGLALWRRTATRALALLCAMSCALGSILTLTRSVWLAAAVGAVLGAAAAPRLRGWLPLLLPAAAVGIALFLLAVPGLRDDAGDRFGEQRPVWDRLNTNAAAVRLVLDRPLTGVGWERFRFENEPYIRQADDYPVSNTDIQVHNVALSIAAELGLVGAGLWLVAFGLAVAHPLLRPVGGADLRAWRHGLVAVAAAWVCVAMFGPLPYAFPNLAVWLWGGIVLQGHLRDDPEPTA